MTLSHHRDSFFDPIRDEAVVVRMMMTLVINVMIMSYMINFTSFNSLCDEVSIPNNFIITPYYLIVEGPTSQNFELKDDSLDIPLSFDTMLRLLCMGCNKITFLSAFGHTGPIL